MPDLAGRALPILGLNPKGVGLRGGETAPLGEVRARAKALSEPLQRSGDSAPSAEGVRGAGEAPDNPSSLRLGRAAKGGKMYLDEELVRKIYEIAEESHSKYCSSPCFDEEDVRQYLGHLLLGDLKVEYDGTTVRTNWDVFGNTSWTHFIGSVSIALNEILDRLEP